MVNNGLRHSFSRPTINSSSSRASMSYIAYINNAVNGLLFEPSNVDDLVSKIELLKDESVRQKLGAEAG